MRDREVIEKSEPFVWSAYSSPHVRLGVSKNATEKEIRKAYRRLSRQFHPDRQISANNAKKYVEQERNNDTNTEGRFVLLTDAFDKLMEKLHGQEDRSPFVGAQSAEGMTIVVGNVVITLDASFKAVRDEAGNIRFVKG